MNAILFDAITAARQLGEENDQARQTWQELLAEGGDTASEALATYRSVQSRYEAACDAIIDPTGRTGLVADLSANHQLGAAVASLPDELRQFLKKLLDNLRLEHLLDGVPASTGEDQAASDGYESAASFAERVAAWVLSAHLTDSMRQIWDLRRNHDEADFESAVESNWRFQELDGWARGLAMYRQALAAAEAADDGSGDPDFIAKAVAWDLYLVLRRRTDVLNDRMRDEIEESRAAVSALLKELPVDQARLLVAFMETAMPLPQTQTKTQLQPHAQPVSLL
jgi:hypothetical protein